MRAHQIFVELNGRADPARARILQGFFKTGPGEYGEGDVFLGITVPELRKIAKVYGQLPRSEIQKLLYSPIHEARVLALMILVLHFLREDGRGQDSIYRFYLRLTARINNWDLVDLSAPTIVGAYLAQRDKRPLLRLTKSKNLWERRIAILATFYFIRAGEFGWTLRLAQQLLHDPHELIHKAVGWMLREVGKRDQAALRMFLDRHHPGMPRVMLRYAIERLPERIRKHYLTRRKAE